LEHYHEKDGVISLSVQELESKKKYLLSANMDYDGDMWIWSIADYPTLMAGTVKMTG